MEAIGAPITDADNAAIAAKIRESPNILIPSRDASTVKIAPMLAPKTSAGEKTPPKKPILRQIIVTNSLKIRIINRNDNEYEFASIPSIVSPPNPRISGIKPPHKPQMTAAM
jgi:hypothetical protein